MKRILITTAISVALIACSLGMPACATSTDNFDDMPISIESSWIINLEGYYCLRLDITNNGNKTIRDIQGIFYFTDYGHNDTIINSFSWNKGFTLYLYDISGREIYRQPTTKIKPGETLSLVIRKMPRNWVSYVSSPPGKIYLGRHGNN